VHPPAVANDPLPACECDLLTRVADWPELRALAQLTRPVLTEVAAAHGIDFATALLYDRLRRSQQHGAFIRRVDELIAQPPPFTGTMDVLLAVAPGAFYQELPRAGGDGRLIREALAAYGCHTAVIPTRSMGTVAENARIIRDWLGERSAERILLASISKGAADIKAAMAMPDADAAFRPVLAWLNASGLPNGTPIANWLFERPLATLFYRAAFWWKGLDIEVLRQTTWGPGTVLDFPLALPAHVQLISVVGFPLRRHLSSKPLRRYHGRLAPRGPNDGLLLLADACSLPGLVYPVWGTDHNLRAACGVPALTAALVSACGLAGTHCEPLTRKRQTGVVS
jgi:hypothetical protein